MLMPPAPVWFSPSTLCVITASGIGRDCWVLTLVFIVASSFFVFSSFARLFKPTGGGLVEEPPRGERALSVEVVRPFLVVLTLIVTGCAMDARAQVVPVETGVSELESRL